MDAGKWLEKQVKQAERRDKRIEELEIEIARLKSVGASQPVTPANVSKSPPTNASRAEDAPAPHDLSRETGDRRPITDSGTKNNEPLLSFPLNLRGVGSERAEAEQRGADGVPTRSPAPIPLETSDSTPMHGALTKASNTSQSGLSDGSSQRPSGKLSVQERLQYQQQKAEIWKRQKIEVAEALQVIKEQVRRYHDKPIQTDLAPPFSCPDGHKANYCYNNPCEKHGQCIRNGNMQLLARTDNGRPTMDIAYVS
jgi:hypothetical protein